MEVYIICFEFKIIKFIIYLLHKVVTEIINYKEFIGKRYMEFN